MVRAARMESSGKILVILDRKHFSFLVQVIDRGHLNAVGEGSDLDIFEFLNKGW